jgi:N-acetyl-gamma-glutamylphosphate reductase
MIAGQPIFFSAMDGLTQSYIFKLKLQNCELIDLSPFVVYLRESHLEYWTPWYSETHPREHSSKRANYHQWCASSTKRALVTHSP